MKQELKLVACSNFQITFLHLVIWTPQDEASGQVDIFVRSSGQVDLWLDVPPIGEALGHVDIFVRSLGQADFWSDVPPPGEALGQVDLWSDVPRMRFWVRLTFGQTLGQVDLWSDVPPRIRL